MKLTITPRLLRYLVREIELGRPISALLRAAEYLDKSSHLWEGLVQAAQPHLSATHYKTMKAAVKKIVRSEPLSPAERLKALAIREAGQTGRSAFIPLRRHAKGWRSIRRRQMLRLRKF